MEKQTISTMIAKNLADEAEAIKGYLPLLESYEAGSDEYLQIAEIIADELSHSLVLTGMLVKEAGLVISDDAKSAIAFLAKKV